MKTGQIICIRKTTPKNTSYKSKLKILLPKQYSTMTISWRPIYTEKQILIEDKIEKQ
jgi:hypothetical protein